MFHGTFAERIEGIRDSLPLIKLWLWVDDGAGPCPEWATPYEAAAEAGTPEAVRGPWGRDGDHLLLLYTGGTTGMPKGVMWRQDDLFRTLVGTVDPGVSATPSPISRSSVTPCRRPASGACPRARSCTARAASPS